MRKIIFLIMLIFTGTVLSATPGIAQEALDSVSPVAASKPTVTAPSIVAMVYNKLTRQPPNFEALAKQTQVYKDASAFEQAAVLESEEQKMKEDYKMLAVSDPIIVQTQVKLSSFNAANHGFFVENFKTATFFPVRYSGQSYAIVPQGIVDKQWLKMDDPITAQAVQAASAASSGGLLTMILQLTPQYADTNTASIDGESYFPIAASVKKMMLYTPDSATLLWQSLDDTAKDMTHDNILKLYQ